MQVCQTDIHISFPAPAPILKWLSLSLSLLFPSTHCHPRYEITICWCNTRINRCTCSNRPPLPSPPDRRGEKGTLYKSIQYIHQCTAMNATFTSPSSLSTTPTVTTTNVDTLPSIARHSHPSIHPNKSESINYS